MVDNAKYILEKEMDLDTFDSYIEILEADHYVKEEINNKSFKRFIVLVCKTDTSFWPKNEIKNLHKMKITIEYNVEKEQANFVIQNSLRKWYFGKKSTKDFNRNTYLKCIELFSEKILLEFNDFFFAKITYLELGFTIRLKPQYAQYLPTLIKHKRLKLKSIIKNETVRFEGGNLCLQFYNKLDEVYEHTDLKQKGYKKIAEKYYFLRIELKFKKISGVAFSKNKLNSVQRLIFNWNEAFEYLESQIEGVKSTDYISPQIVKKLKVGSGKDIIEWLAFIGIDVLKPDVVDGIVENVLLRPYETHKKIDEISNKYRKTLSPSFKDIIREKIKEKEEYMKYI